MLLEEMWMMLKRSLSSSSAGITIGHVMMQVVLGPQQLASIVRLPAAWYSYNGKCECVTGHQLFVRRWCFLDSSGARLVFGKDLFHHLVTVTAGQLAGS